MARTLSPRDFDNKQRQPQLTLVTAAFDDSGAAGEKDSGSEIEASAPLPQNSDQNADENPGADSIGGILRRARMARGGPSLDDIGHDLCIRPHLLEALEKDDFDQMPGLIYASGFLRSYATWLGLDPAPLVERLKATGQAPQADAPLVFPEPINDPRIPRKPLVALAVILCVAVYGAWYSFSGSGDNLETISAPPPDMQALSVPDAAPLVPGLAPEAAQPAPSVMPAPSAMEAPAAPTPQEAIAALTPPPPSIAAPVTAPAAGQVLLRATADSWIRITGPDDKIITERILKAGDSYAVPAAAGYRLLAGNAGGLMVETLDGRYGPLGASGDVRRNFALDPATFAQSLPAAQ